MLASINIFFQLIFHFIIKKNRQSNSPQGQIFSSFHWHLRVNKINKISNFIIEYLMIVKILIILLVLLSPITADQPPKTQKNQIVDANHYYSEKNKDKTYTIDQLEKDKSLVVVLKPINGQRYNNTITLVLTSGSSKKQCKMRSFDDLCVLQSIPSDQGSMDIKCDKLPCQVQWKIYQPAINKLQNSEKVENLYQLPKDTDRLIVNLFCKSVVEKQNNQRSSIGLAFSTMPFSRLDISKEFLFLIFQDIKQGFLHLFVNPAYKNCAQLKVASSPKALASQKLVNDFVRKGKKNIYSLPDIPDGKDFRFDLSFHTPVNKLEKYATITITGKKDGDRKTIRTNKIQFNQTFKNFDLSYGIPKINTSQWKQVQFQLEIQSENPIFIDIKQAKADKIEVESTQFSFFDLKKGQKLQYLLVPEEKAEDKDQIKINLSNQSKLKSSQSSCKVKPGCSFTLEALDDIQGFIFLGVGKGLVKQALIFDFGETWSFTHKIKQLENIYIKKKLQLNKAIQVAINSPNVVIYAANSKKCQYPSQQCYQRLGNIHRHFIYSPKTEDQTLVYFLIKALDSCQFTLTLIQESTEFVDLTDSQPFVYLFDHEEKQLAFRFTRKEKKDTSFNLIAPVGALDLIVENGKKIPQDEDATISSEGFLLFKASQYPKDTFTVLVRKRDAYMDKFVHFTLIASSKGKMIRLESGITHYQTLQSKQDGKGKMQYIFQFDPTQKFILNFYSHNNKESQMKILLTLTALSQDSTQKKQISDIYIDKPADVLDLSDFSQKLCAKVDDQASCQISLSLTNKMDREIDIAITLMEHHTILQLKDGIWQSFSLNSIAKSSHFYFFPRNVNDDVGIMFKTTDPAIRLKYRLFYSSPEDIDMSQWPFPSENLSKQDTSLQKSIRPVNHFNIGKSTLKACWPNCVVLISVVDLIHKQNQGSFSLMASNSIMQIPEKEKIDVVLKAEETKAYLVDLKYALDIEQNIYFYVYHSIGLTNIWVNVYSEKNDRIPDSESFDFSLNSEKQIAISIQAIKDVMKKQQMEDHNDISLFIVVEAITDSKLSIQFTFKEQEQENYKLLALDSFEHVNVSPNSKRIFYLPSDQIYQIKIARQTGFPFYAEKTCKQKLDECLEQFKDEQDDKKTQILTKVAAYTSKPCQGCYYAFKISTQTDPAELTVHAQSIISEIQLSENKAVYDFTQKAEENRYTFYAIRGEEIFVNIHVTQGQVEVQMTDLNKIKEKRTGKNIISFVVPKESTMTEKQKFSSKKLTKQQQQTMKQEQKDFQSITILKNQNQELAQALMSAFGLSDRFIQIHIRVRSTSEDKPSIYTISYSSGQREFELQDGLITSYMLEPKKQALFYYSTGLPNHIYFTISMEKAAFLKDLKISTKYCEPKEGIIDDDCWVEISSGSPTIKDKVPHPTLMYMLPNKNNLGITLEYSGDHSEKVSLGINHQEIMILPFENEYPFVLHSNQSIHFLVELSNDGYIQIVTRKCDESNPTFSYTFDYDAFQKEQFSYQVELGANPKSRFISKVKPGTLYMQMKTDPQEQSMVSIYVRYSQKKIFDPEIVPGNKGNMEYSIIDSSNGQIKIKPPTCPDSHCPSNFKYSLMISTNMRDLYSQLVCPSSFFTNSQFYQSQKIKLNQVTPKSNSDGTLTIPFKLADQISYVGVKVTSKDKQIYYKPIQVATLWGQLSRTSHSHKMTIGVITILAILSIVICVRRNARKGYRQIEDQI